MRLGVRFEPLILSATLLLLPFANSTLSAHAEIPQPDSPHFLYVNSYRPGYAWSDRIELCLRQRLEQLSVPARDLHIEYLDAKVFAYTADSALTESVLSLWQQRYPVGSLDLVLASDQDAYELVCRAHDRLFPGLPLVYTGVEDPVYTPVWSVGIHSVADIEGNVELIQRLLPAHTRIWAVTDQSLSGRLNRQRLSQFIHSTRTTARLAFLDPGEGLSLNQLLALVADIPPDDAVYFADFALDTDGYVPTMEVLPRLTAVSRAPVFSHVDQYIGTGVVGGMVSSPDMQGRQLADLAMAVLTGTLVPDGRKIPENTRPVFERAALRRFGIDPHQLPPGSELLGKPAVSHRELLLFLGLLLFVILQSFLIVGLTRARRRERAMRLRADAAAVSVVELFEHAPIPMARYARDGTRIILNRKFCEELGYRQADLPDLASWWTLAYPDPVIRESVQATWAGVIQGLLVGGSGDAGEFSIRCGDGVQRVMHITANLLHDSVIVSFLDVSEKVRAHGELQKTLENFRILFDLSPYSCVITDYDGRLLLANTAFCDSLGLPTEEILGKTGTELGRCVVPSEAQDYMNALLEAGEISGRELCVDVAGMGRRHMLLATRLIEFDDRPAVLSAIIDVTERIRAELALRDSEENLRITLDSIGDAVIATDIQGRVSRMNPVAEKLTGWTLAEAAGKGLNAVFRIVNAGTREPVTSPVERVIQTGQVVGLANHTLLISRTGEEYQIADSGAPIRTEAGELVGVVLVFRDVSEEYRLQEQLAQSQKLDAVGQLAGGIAHDFNNVLTGILGATELLQDGVESAEEEQEYIDIILQAVRTAAELTHNLLSFARNQPESSTAVDLHLVIRDTLALLEKSIDKRIRITQTLTADEYHVIGDASLLQSVFLNLGINASHAMPDGGTLTFRTQLRRLGEKDIEADSLSLAAGKYVEIEVEDTGTGISPDVLPRIFDPFFTTKAKGKGTGLGLSAVYGTVRQHGGTIAVNSQQGVGTCFRLLFPITEQELPEPMANRESLRGQGRILLTEDERAVSTTTCQILQRAGYTVSVATNGVEALGAYQPGAFDLVILDMMMPEMNGRDCFLALKERDPDVRIILMSGFLREEDLQELRDLGLSGFLRKPFYSNLLLNTVAGILRNPGAQ